MIVWEAFDDDLKLGAIPPPDLRCGNYPLGAIMSVGMVGIALGRHRRRADGAVSLVT